MVFAWAPFSSFLRHKPSILWYNEATLDLTLQSSCSPNTSMSSELATQHLSTDNVFILLKLH